MASRPAAGVPDMPIRLTHRFPIPTPTSERRYGLMAETLRFVTNDPALLAAADASFGRFAVPVDGREPLVVSLFSEAAPPGTDPDVPTMGEVVVRTHDNLYLMTAGARDVAVAAWNDFLGPLVYLRAPDSFTVSLGMATFQGVHVNDVHYSVAMALIALVPPIVVFVLAQRFLVRGVAAGGWRA